MKRQHLYRFGALAVLGLVVLAGVALSPDSASSQSPIGNQVLRHAVDVQLGRAVPRTGEMPISSGALYAALDQSGALNRRAARLGRSPAHVQIAGTEGCQNQFVGNGQTNIRVVQDCSLRAQAGESIAVNPTEDANMLVSQNDSRLGFNHCGYDWTLDGAQHWGDQTPPFWQFQLLDDHVGDACANATVTWDSQGSSYIGGMVFNTPNPGSAIVVARSNAGIHGAFFHSPDAAGGFQEYRALPLGVVANDVKGTIFNDKPTLLGDSHPASPKRDNVYVTWTKIKPEIDDGTRTVSPIMFSESTDGGVTWSPEEEISGEAEGVCPGECANDQGSAPFIGPDGTIYVAFANNDTIDRPNQQILLVKCPDDEDCTEEEAWTEPVIVEDLIGGSPLGPSAAGCPSSDPCLPPNGYRALETLSISTSVDAAGNI